MRMRLKASGDMIEQMLTLLNGGIPVKSNGCNCGPGGPPIESTWFKKPILT